MARFSKVPKTFRARKAVPKTPTRSFCKAGVFSYVAKGRKIKITAKFHALRRLRFEDTKRTMSPEMHPKSFGTFEKRAGGGQAVPVDGSTQSKFGICERSSLSQSSKRISHPHFIHGR